VNNLLKTITYNNFGTIIADNNPTFKISLRLSDGDTNIYRYVLGDPVGFVDPSGLTPLVLLLISIV